MLVLLAAFVFGAGFAQDDVERAGYFEVRSASTEIVDGVHALDARLQLVLPTEALAALEEAERKLDELVEAATGAARADVDRLVAAYQAMDEKAAAAIIDQMDVGFASGLLAEMANDPAAAILAELPPEKAYAITAHIAGRNMRAPAK